MNTLVVIPARYASTRFPGKPLALLGGRAIVEHVWLTASATEGVDRAIVATDDQRILDHMTAVGGTAAAMLTASTHHSGTDRCGEVLRRLEAQGEHYDTVVNLQGDEPFVEPGQIQALADRIAHGHADIATLRTRIATVGELLSPNNVKLVCAADGQALYFSRQPLPYRRGVPQEQWLDGVDYYKHVGIYAFRAEVLHRVCALPPAVLEDCEKLEQLRWLAAGYRIAVVDTPHANIGIDTPDDLAEAERIWKSGISAPAASGGVKTNQK